MQAEISLKGIEVEESLSEDITTILEDEANQPDVTPFIVLGAIEGKCRKKQACKKISYDYSILLEFSFKISVST